MKIAVLNVDDDAANRYAITRLLRLGNFEVSEASSGSEALAKVRAERPDVVVLDVNLPDLSGHEVCARIKADPDLAGISVLQLSAIAVRSADRVTGLDSGADGYLTMPVEPEELIATVRALMRARRAEEEARHAALSWRATFDAIGEGVAVLGSESELLQMNRAMALMFPEPPKIDSSFPAALDSAFDLDLSSTASLFTSTRRELREFGVVGRWLRFVSDPIVEDGIVTGRVLTVSDLSEQRRLEDDLRQHVAMLAESDRRKDEFLAMLGHELRTPLSAISAALYNLNQPDEPVDPKWLREVASRQVEQLARLVDDLLDVSRITKGKIQLRKEAVDVRRTIRDVQHAAEPLIESKQQTLEISVPDETLGVHGDSARLEQIVSNLVNNAAKYTRSGGRVRVIAEGDQHEVSILVADNGSGIAPELLPRIFELFTQGEQPMDRPAGGLGIGLTVVRSLVKLHGGTIEAFSAGVDQGSSFILRLPRVFGAVDEEGSGIWTRKVPHIGAGMAIVVAEDNDDLRDLMRVMLERRGHHVTLADNGAAALDRIREAVPDVALIDLGLPQLDGYEVGRRVRAEFPNVRLIAISGYGRDEDLERSREAGFTAHLVKPVRPAELFEALNG
jgi:signal transduction histidine kinase